MDVVLTVCGNARDESCPIWPGAPVTAHWGVEDPADVTEPAEAVRDAFSEAYERLQKRANQLIEVRFEDMQREQLQRVLRDIGETG